MTEDQTSGGETAYPANAVHMMRTAQLAQLQLSAMADNKASILMGAAFVIFTITIGQARAAGGAPLPLLILGASAFFAAIFAVLTVLPKSSGGTPKGERNILFFGVFTRMEEAEFIDEVTARLATEDSIYRTMARDIYQNGTVLQNKKYRMLAYAYRVFLAGLVLSCAAYVAQHFLGLPSL
ncbi:MAG TPA: Pycsar system effector family protein [Allosphingosinicella sp.]|nr:Pycsar system effector family protein [Allosphingosinicella sp.]